MKNTVRRLGILDARLLGKVLLVSAILTLGASAAWGIAVVHSAESAKVQLGLCLAFAQLGLSLVLWFPAAGRLGILIMLVSAAHGGFVVVRAGTRPGQVRLPARSIHELPRTLGVWHGEDPERQGEEAEIHAKIFVGTGALDAVDRIYTDRSGHATSLFVALYDDPEAGVYHTPSNCYRSNGWTNIDDVPMPLEVPGRPTISVSLSTWESGDKRIQVLCWYEMGEHVLFDRRDWGLLQFKLRGQTIWPPMYKVLLQTQVLPGGGPATTRLLDLAGQVRGWLGELDAPAAAAEQAP